MLINFQKQSKFFNHFNQGSEREHPHSPLIGYASAFVTELRNIRFQSKVWLQLKIFWQNSYAALAFQRLDKRISYTYLLHTLMLLYGILVFPTTILRNLLWNFLSEMNFNGCVHFLYLLFFCFALTTGENYVEPHMNWIWKKEKLNIKISTPLKHNTSKALKNYWFLWNIVKHYLCFIRFPGNKLLRHCKLYLYI